MPFEYSSALQTALAVAANLARRNQASAILPPHLLGGLLAEDEGQPCAQLRRAGLDLEAWRLGHPIPAEGAAGPEMPVAAAVRMILSQARELASLHSSEGTITTDQVLMALLNHDGELRGQLEALGMQFAQLAQNFTSQAPPLQLEEPLDLGEPQVPIDLARLMDASANRAREGMRVVEDYCRFVLNDSYLTGQWKQLRHDLTTALGTIAPPTLLQARDTLADVGATLKTPQEQRRDSLLAVAQANVKRVQEALRSLEEVAKTDHPELAAQLEKSRYVAYSLEKATLLGMDSRRRLVDARLYLLATTSLCRGPLSDTIEKALVGGADLIQLREKNMADRALLALARQVRRLTRAAGALFIMNDRADLALLADADGVHLGQDDMAIQDARRLLGPKALIGVSTHNRDQLRRAILEGADYVGVGPTFPTSTKSFAALAGLDYVRQAMAETSLPAFVLGGVNLDNLDQVLAAGGQRIAVSQAICAADQPHVQAAAFKKQLTLQRSVLTAD